MAQHTVTRQGGSNMYQMSLFTPAGSLEPRRCCTRAKSCPSVFIYFLKEAAILLPSSGGWLKMCFLYSNVFYPFFISLNCGAAVTQSFPVKWSLKRLSKLFPQYSEKHIALRIRSEAMQALYADAPRRASKGACDRQCRTVIAGHYIFPSHSAGPFELLSSTRCRCEGHASSISFRFLSLKPTRLCSPCWKTAAGVVLFTRKGLPRLRQPATP